MEALILLGIAVVWVLLAITSRQSYLMMREIYYRFPEARKVFIAHNTLKLWVFGYTCVVIVSVVVGGYPEWARLPVTLTLIGTLIAQAGWVAWTYNSWVPIGGKVLRSWVGLAMVGFAVVVATLAVLTFVVAR